MSGVPSFIRYQLIREVNVIWIVAIVPKYLNCIKFSNDLLAVLKLLYR